VSIEAVGCACCAKTQSRGVFVEAVAINKRHAVASAVHRTMRREPSESVFRKTIKILFLERITSNCA
jgi:hypothetical protein